MQVISYWAVAALGVLQVHAQDIQSGLGKYFVKKPPLDTPWTSEVGTRPWPEYPRPQLRRHEWKNLNGIWRYMDARGNDAFTGMVPTWENLDQEVLVPSCLESGLSGIQAKDARYSWYSLKFQMPGHWSDRVLLNFGAVDYEATIYIDSAMVGVHRGGYTSFTLDITNFVEAGNDHELAVYVHDPTDAEGYNVPIGKQTRNPSHIFYTPCSGIWQSVWLESVPQSYITRLDVYGAMDGKVTVKVSTNDNSSSPYLLTIYKDGPKQIARTGIPNTEHTLYLPNPRLWSPDSPELYDITIKYGDDFVTSYMGFRTIEVGKVNGVQRPLLNGKFVFQMGTLDQGYWPDGIYTPPTREAMLYDLELLKEYGFNMVRKHMKVENALYYQACDVLGIMVVQDMPSMRPAHNVQPSDEDEAEFGRQLEEMVQQHLSYPSIVTWTIYNEGWGQRDGSPEIAHTETVRRTDPTRLIDSTSGWHDHGAGDFSSNHHYLSPECGTAHLAQGISKAYDPKRIGFQSEFGGLGTNLSIENLWNDAKAIASIDETYAVYDDFRTWNEKSHKFLRMLRDQVEKDACSGAVWTQTTDVEGEVNGLMSYDRRTVRSKMALHQWKIDIQALYYAAGKRSDGDVGAEMAGR